MINNSYSIQFTTCLFYVLLMLSFTLTVSNISDESKKEKAFPITVLVINSLVMFSIFLNLLGVNMFSQVPKYSLLLFFIILVLSFVLSIENLSDKDQENKSLPTITLIVNSVVVFMIFLNIMMTMMKN